MKSEKDGSYYTIQLTGLFKNYKQRIGSQNFNVIETF